MPVNKMTIILAKDFRDAERCAIQIKIQPSRWIYARNMETISGWGDVWLVCTPRYHEHPDAAPIMDYAQQLLDRGYATLYPQIQVGTDS